MGHIQRRLTTDQCRNSGPGRVDQIHHHTPVALSDSAHNPGSQQRNHRTLRRAPEHLKEPLISRFLQTDEQIDHNDQATHSSSR